MKRISPEFNPKNKRSVRNLHEVLKYLEPELEFKDERNVDEETESALYRMAQTRYPLQEALPEQPAKALETLLLPGGKLSPEMIRELNERLVARKYQDPQNIRQLHNSLLTLRKKAFVRLDINEEEVKAGKVGDSTRAFIAAFQKKYKLPQTGRIDAATDEKLESVITSIAGSKPQPKKLLKTRNVPELARVVRSLRINHAGERVQHLQKGLAWLGYTIHAQEYNAQTYALTTKNAVKQFQTDHQLPITGRVDKATARAINLELAKANPRLLSCEKIRVRGTVRDEQWLGMGGVVVQVFEKGLAGPGALLGERATFANGFFDVFFKPPHDPYRLPLHLVVRFLHNGQELATKTYYNVKKVLWANYTAGEQRYQGPSEYEQLMRTLTPALRSAGMQIDEIEESAARQDISYLYRQTGILPEIILKLSLAHRVANQVQRDELPAAIFYAFLRQNLPPEMPGDVFPDAPEEWDDWMPRLVEQVTNGLIFLDGDIQQAALENALALNYIPRALIALFQEEEITNEH